MADLTFSQPARRNLVIPVVLAIAVLVASVLTVLHFTPHSTADAAVTHTAVYPSHLVFKSNSIVLNSDQAQDDLYILTTLRITNHLRLPIFLKDFRASLSPAPGTSNGPLTSSAIEKTDLANLFTTLSALGKFAAAQPTQPLYRETRIDPGQTVEGYIVLHFPGPQALWNNRQNASVTVDLYHQSPLMVDIPNTSIAAPAPTPQP